MASIFRAADDSSSAESVEDAKNEALNASADETASTESVQRGSLPNASAFTQLIGSYPNLPGPQLPDLQPHQHSTLFYLSLIEGRCRTQAANVLHLPEHHPEVHILAQQLFKEMTKTLHKAGILPEEFAAQELSDLRTTYLSSFDSILRNIAANRAGDFQENNSYSSLFERSQAYTVEGTQLSTSINSGRAFALQQYTMEPAAVDMVSRLRSLSLEDTIYKTKYEEQCLIGKGGFGVVYKAFHLLDQCSYAIKKVRLKAKDTVNPEVKATEILSELRVLARLLHPNIVRYHHSWTEKKPPGLPGDDSGESESDEETDAPVPKLKDTKRLQAGPSSSELHVSKQLAREFRHSRQVSRILSDGGDNIVFARSASDKPAASFKESTKPKKSFFKSAGSQDDSDSSSASDSSSENEISTEEVPRKTEIVKSSTAFDVIVYIQMSLHPMSLEHYLWPKKSKADEANIEIIQHCYHCLPTARILLAILDGVEYIHANKIVHRDLKPANIMLSISHGSGSMRNGSINVSDCPECSGKNQKALYITPHIGDFGLVAEIQDPEASEPSLALEAVGSSADIPTSSTTQPTSSYSKMVAAKSKAISSNSDNLALGPVRTPPAVQSRQVGTRFYMAPRSSKEKPIICSKVDVYSLGVIALEMLVHFTTGYERGIELEKLKSGGFPQGLNGHPMADGIKGMLAIKREDRWDTPDVREWLEVIIEKAKRT